MTPPLDVIRAIARAVEKQGGDMTDVDDLVRVWERIEADRCGRVERMRYEASNGRCCCADGGQPANDGRCPRCLGRLEPRP